MINIIKERYVDTIRKELKRKGIADDFRVNFETNVVIKVLFLNQDNMIGTN